MLSCECNFSGTIWQKASILSRIVFQYVKLTILYCHLDLTIFLVVMGFLLLFLLLRCSDILCTQLLKKPNVSELGGLFVITYSLIHITDIFIWQFLWTFDYFCNTLCFEHKSSDIIWHKAFILGRIVCLQVYLTILYELTILDGVMDSADYIDFCTTLHLVMGLVFSWFVRHISESRVYFTFFFSTWKLYEHISSEIFCPKVFILCRIVCHHVKLIILYSHFDLTIFARDIGLWLYSAYYSIHTPCIPQLESCNRL